MPPAASPASACVPRQHVYGSGIVLVVDDEPEAAELLGGTEHGDDYDWVSASSGSDLRAVSTVRPSIRGISTSSVISGCQSPVRARSRRRSLRSHDSLPGAPSRPEGRGRLDRRRQSSPRAHVQRRLGNFRRGKPRDRRSPPWSKVLFACSAGHRCRENERDPMPRGKDKFVRRNARRSRQSSRTVARFTICQLLAVREFGPTREDCRLSTIVDPFAPTRPQAGHSYVDYRRRGPVCRSESGRKEATL